MTSALPPYKQAFLETCIKAQILTFGEFTLKSGRKSPYFFQAGNFSSTHLLSAITTAYAETLTTNPVPEFDVLFGPAYKGIPLASGTALKLYELAPEKYAHVGYAFNRKEAKAHGEGGNMVGMSMKGKRVLVVDDVMTAGTAMREAVEIIKREGGVLVGVVVCLDRMEMKVLPEEGGSGLSTVQEIERELEVPVYSILTLDDLISGVDDQEKVAKMEEYRKVYAAKKQ
ncbi:orotate phosphoribosyltransferase [Ascobolus immersus RN42]|uniref:Orotate phosphoribosyltransferase n=1 Tax=Ascobolus immersus RN42 TaxID=1160509 RepID=A0A3N4I6G5_ASCIM|nr:orotate phosphoribosyltransferase [Ascobolus immersus RN42]